MSCLRSWDSKEEISTRGEWLRKNRRPLAILVLLFVLFSISIGLYNYNNDGNAEYEISYSVTVWVLPLEEEFAIHLEFYGTQQNAEEQVNRLHGFIFAVQPTSNEEHTFYLTNLPEGFSGFWVRMYLSDDSDSFTIINADIGYNTTTSVLGREISILIEPFQVSDN